MWQCGDRCYSWGQWPGFLISRSEMRRKNINLWQGLHWLTVKVAMNQQLSILALECHSVYCMYECVYSYWERCPHSTSLHTGCSARVSQNSQASKATFSSWSWVLCSMYWDKSKKNVIYIMLLFIKLQNICTTSTTSVHRLHQECIVSFSKFLANFIQTGLYSILVEDYFELWI